ncbi:hypothetical protein [Microbulbifer sp. DLAB2-AA]|uniref:hypothetical protein n=1 Tax=Microbulbifer sp. DLAB2-AA TaxID=3243394 RepID=UPI0040396652
MAKSFSDKMTYKWEKIEKNIPWLFSHENPDIPERNFIAQKGPYDELQIMNKQWLANAY